MSVETVYKCDVCGAVRQPSNHWLMAAVGSKPGLTKGIRFQPWDADEAEYMTHLCGAACAGKTLSQVLESWRT